MEFLGFQTCMNFLTGCGVVIGTFISDRYIQIACHMKNEKKYENFLCSTPFLVTGYAQYCRPLRNSSLTNFLFN